MLVVTHIICFIVKPITVQNKLVHFRILVWKIATYGISHFLQWWKTFSGEGNLCLLWMLYISFNLQKRSITNFHMYFMHFLLIVWNLERRCTKWRFLTWATLDALLFLYICCALSMILQIIKCKNWVFLYRVLRNMDFVKVKKRKRIWICT